MGIGQRVREFGCVVVVENYFRFQQSLGNNYVIILKWDAFLWVNDLHNS